MMTLLRGLGDDREYVDMYQRFSACQLETPRVGTGDVRGISNSVHSANHVFPWTYFRIYINEYKQFRGFIITPSGTDITDSARTVTEDTAVTFKVELKKSSGGVEKLPSGNRAGAVTVNYELSGDALVVDSTVTVGTTTTTLSAEDVADSSHTGTLPFPVGINEVDVVVTPAAVTGADGDNRTLVMDLSGPFTAMATDNVRLDTRDGVIAGDGNTSREYTRRETLITITVTD